MNWLLVKKTDSNVDYLYFDTFDELFMYLECKKSISQFSFDFEIFKLIKVKIGD